MAEQHLMYRCPGPSVRADQWNKLQTSRAATIARLNLYLNEAACVAGVPTDVGGLDPYADELGKAFRSLVCHEMSGHKDSVESLRSMRAIATVFSEILHLIATADLPGSIVSIDDAPLTYKGTRERLSLEGLKQFNIDATALPAPDAQGANSLELAGLLAAAFPKAWAEYQTSASRDDADATLHHAAILGDIYAEMVDLLQYMQLRDEQDFTEFRIPQLRELLNTSSD